MYTVRVYLEELNGMRSESENQCIWLTLSDLLWALCTYCIYVHVVGQGSYKETVVAL